MSPVDNLTKDNEEALVSNIPDLLARVKSAYAVNAAAGIVKPDGLNDTECAVVLTARNLQGVELDTDTPHNIVMHLNQHGIPSRLGKAEADSVTLIVDVAGRNFAANIESAVDSYPSRSEASRGGQKTQRY